MDGIMQERPNECPILNFQNIHYRQSLNKTFGTHVEKSMIFNTFKKICFIPKVKGLINRKLRNMSMKYKIFGIQSETLLLINCGKISSLSIKNWESS